MKEIDMTLNNGGKIVGKLRKTSSPRSLIILVHGFTGTMDGPGGTSWIKLSKALAKQNFDVFRFNFRFTSPGYKNFQNMTILSEVSDLEYILKKFSKKYEKIVLVGESLGGAISILALDEKVDCLVLWYPAIDLPEASVLKDFETAPALEELAEKGYVTIVKGSTGEKIKVGRKFIIEAALLSFANHYMTLKKILCPTLIISPDKDMTVPFWQSVKALKLIQSKKKKLIRVKNSDHAWWKLGRKKRDWAAESFAIKETVKWIKSNI